MGKAETIDANVGVEFPTGPRRRRPRRRDVLELLNLRDFPAGSGSTASAFTTPVTRWPVTPAGETADHRGGRQVGRTDLDELREAADDARRRDSKYGGGNWKATPPPKASTTEQAPDRSRTLQCDLRVVALATWTAFDVGEYEIAQRHFIQALRLPRAGGDVQLGCHAPATAAMQSLMRGFASEAVDMTQGAFERAKGHASSFESKTEPTAGLLQPSECSHSHEDGRSTSMDRERRE